MIKQATLQDFDYFYSLYMHPQVNPYLLYEPMNEESFRPIFEELLYQGVLYLFEAEGQVVGMFKLIHLKHRNSHIGYLGGVAIHPDFAGKGYGQQMMEAVLVLGKQIGLLRIELSTATTNDKAIKLYERVGFEQEGVLRNYTHLKSEGRFLDEVMMSYLYQTPTD
ncbi:MAG: GNAT family protein [Spirosomataceae bacterium]